MKLKYNQFAIDELIEKYPHHDIYIYYESLNTPNLEVVSTLKYRFLQKEFDISIYYPQKYNSIKEE